MWPVYKSICNPHIIHIHWLIGPWVSQVSDPWDLPWPDARTVNVAVDYSGHGCRRCFFWPGVEDGGGSGEAERGWRGGSIWVLYGLYYELFSSSRIWEDDWTGCFRIFRRVTPRQMIAGVLSPPLPTWRHLFEGLQPWWFYDTWHIWNRVCKGYFGRSHNNTSPMTNVWHAASMCKSLGIPHAEKKDRLIHRKNGWSRVSRVKSKSHKDTPIKSC